MLTERNSAENLSEFMRYLAANTDAANDRLPPLSELSQELNISIASLREQMEVARALGFVEVRPKTGIRRLPYTFRPAVRQSLSYAVTITPEYFQMYSDLRNHIEAAYWHQAVAALTEEDHQLLRDLVQRARKKLHGHPVQIPHAEHRELHLSIYCRINNPFVTGILEAYWEMYEAAGLNVYTDLDYLEKVWQYHERMVEEICAGNPAAGFQALIEHVDLIYQRSTSRPLSNLKQQFE